LVVSQKSGVGKTTTAINLAAGAAAAGARVLLLESDPLNGVSAALNLPQHRERKQLRDAGIDLPGILCCSVLPGLDVISPYEEGGCSDEDLDRLLQVLGLEAFAESYDCLIVNAPPFFGGRPGLLLSACEEFMVVMQAEPLAYRTMPAFLEMVQRAVQSEGLSARMRGILLTLPENEEPGGRWERELRGRFGGRVLSGVVPYDAEAGKATLFGQVVLQTNPEASSSVAYRELTGELQLTRDARGAALRPVEATLNLAAAAIRANPPVPRAAPPPPVHPRKSSARMPRLQMPLPAGSPPGPFSEERRGVSPPVPAGLRRAAPGPDWPPPAPAPPLTRSGAIADLARPATLHSTDRPWLVWVGLGVVAGFGLRFIELPDYALPMIVGLAVTAAVTLVLHLGLQSSESSGSTTPAAAPPAPAPGGRLSGPHKKLGPGVRRRDH
jgi:chromosome partitioning protein